SVGVRPPTRRRKRDAGHERTGHLPLVVRGSYREVGQAGGHVAHVGAVDRDGRHERAGTGLGIGNPRTRLHVGVERDGDGRQHAGSEARAARQASPTPGRIGSVASPTKTSRLMISSPSGFSLFSIRTSPEVSKSTYAKRRSADASSTRAHNSTAMGALRRPSP